MFVFTVLDICTCVHLQKLVAEIPAAVQAGVLEEDQLIAEEKAAKRKASMKTTVQVILDRDLIDSKEGSFTELRRAPARSFDVQKYQTLEDLKAVVEAQTGIPRANQAYFVRFTIICPNDLGGWV